MPSICLSEEDEPMRDTNTNDLWPARRLSRRGLLRAAGGAAAASAGLALAACGGNGTDDGVVATAVEGPTSLAPVIGPVEQQKQRRIRLGLTAWDPTKTFDGYTVFTTISTHEAHLIDMMGEVVHTWSFLDPEGDRTMWYVEMLENGNLFAVIHQLTVDAPPFIFKGGVTMEVDWDGNTVWELEDAEQHHDATLLPNGNLLVLRSEPVPRSFAERVPGGLPVEADQEMWGDWVVERKLDGTVVWEWHAWEHLDPTASTLNPQDSRNEWGHANSVDQMPDGNLLISFRNINTVMIIDRDTGDVAWQLGPPLLAQQHHASPLGDSRVMIYDNGAHRLENGLPFSRVVDVDTETSFILREYSESPFFNFFSPFISGAQRLPNDNTLITEGNYGRIFEVTAENEVVWEYINPFFKTNPLLGETNGTFRAYRYPPELFPELS